LGNICPVCGLKLPADANFCPEDGSELEADPLVGAEIGGRRLLEFIGEDALGPKYRAEHLVLGREEAVKLLRAGGNALLKRRFKAEAQAIARLNDPHTVRVYESGPTPDGDVFFAMEMVRGRTLEEVLGAEGAMHPRRAARVGYQAAQALAAAHAHRVLHLDFRPANVLLETDDRGGDFVRVLDFGIGALGKVDDTRYRAPEHLDAHKDLDRRADLFSLGVVLYELLTGVHPFADGDPRRDDPAYPSHEGWAVPRSLADLAMRLLARDRDTRPPDALHVRAAIEESGLLTQNADIATEKRYIKTARLELAEAWAELEAEKARIVRIEATETEWDTPPPILPSPSVRPEAAEPEDESEAQEPDVETDEDAELVYLEPAVNPWLAYAMGVASTLLLLGVLFAMQVVDISW